MAPAEHGTGRDADAPAQSRGEAGRARRSPHGRQVALPQADHTALTTSSAEPAEEIRRPAS